MVSAIRNVEKALGSAEKKPTATEEKHILVARKSIHTASALKKGAVLKVSDLVMKRPGDGISAMKMYDVIGKRLKHDLPEESKLRWEDVE
jgi:N,N'-diacetyllegionaminate synthase